MKKNIETISKKVLECIKEKSKTKELANAILKMVNKEHSNVTGKNLLGLGDFIPECTNPRATYSECKNEADPYGCEKKANYQCEQIYTCGYYFNCDKPSTFQCADDKGFDFNCGDYSCKKEFECEAGHIFQCSQNYSCKKSFTCSAGGQPCPSPTGTYTGEPEPPGGGPTKPGDFECAFREDGDFACLKKFSCKSDDDFDCDSSAGTFVCLRDFTCESGDDFYCQNVFRCSTKDDFSGCPEPTDYTCLKIAECGGSNPYICPPKTNFLCAKPHGGGAE